MYRAAAPMHLATTSSVIGSLLAPGRFNPQGTASLYTSFEPQTAYWEYQQLAAEPRPAVILGLKVKLDRVVDLSDGYTDAWHVDWADALNCEWRLEVGTAKTEKREPDVPGWRCAKFCEDEFAVGIVFPSQRHPGGTNLVIYTTRLVTGRDAYEDLDPQKDIDTAIKAIQKRALAVPKQGSIKPK